jgi:Fe-S cluster biogenesis protein NfuA
MVSSLLVLYGIHPLDFETRLNQGVEKARTFLKSHSADLELLQNDGGRVRLRLTTRGQGCGSNPSVLKEAVEELIYESAPDVTALIIEGAEPQSFVPIAALNASLAKGIA